MLLPGYFGSSIILFLLPIVSSFHLYLPSINKPALIKAYDITESCFDAINSTLRCDSYNLVNALDVDDHEWSSQNLTDLCTPNCANDLSKWMSNVKQACGEQTIPISGMETFATYFPNRYQYGFDTACLRSSTGSWCIPEAYNWEGGIPIQYPEDYCLSGDPDFTPSECNQLNFRPMSTANDTRIIGLYSKELICSECFVKTWQQRLRAINLHSKDQKEYLLSNYEDIKVMCSVAAPATTFDGILTKGAIAATPTQPAAVQTTCAGQSLPLQTSQSHCRRLAEKYSVPFGTLVQLSGNHDCSTNTTLCLPAPCELHMVNGGKSCALVMREINDKYGSNITLTQFLTWNPYILGKCDKLHDVQQVCRSAPGGAYSLPDPIAAPTAGTYYKTAQPALPTQVGTIADCGRYYDVIENDICQTVTVRFGITLDQFFEYNKYLTKDCMNLWAKTSVCVGKVTVPPTSRDGSCGPSADFATCEGTTFGKCCSTSGKCGSTDSECAPELCYSGACMPGAGSETPDGSCGPAHHNWICGKTAFGKCCSIYGWCGGSADHCAPGTCHSGDCDQTIGGPSTDGSCGPNFPGNKICAGTSFGKCCSNHGYCGDGDIYCAKENCHSGACRL